MSSSDNSGLPVIPLSPIAQSYILCSNALSQASEKLNEAKQTHPPVSVDVLRRLIENVRVERHRLDALVRKMQSVEAATPLFWDSDTLARQIVTVNCQLYNAVVLDKRALSQLDPQPLSRLLDFQKYLTHSMAHQLIYWAELTKPNNTITVVPPVHPKDNLVAHLVRVAYLLVHAYRDFSGFAAIMTALTLPEVGRLKRLWQACSSRTKEMFRELKLMVSPANDYQAYRQFIRNKLELYVQIHHSGGHQDEGMMIAIPWIQPHLATLRSIVTIYTAGDNEDQQSLGDIVLSAPGANKMDIEISILELCQRNSTISDSLLEDILAKVNKKRRSSIAAVSKAIHLDGLRTAVIPTANLNHLSPGDQLTHHWLLSRVYLRRDQLIDESKEVEGWKQGEKEIDYEEEIKYTLSRRASVLESGDKKHEVVVTPEKEDKEEVKDKEEDIEKDSEEDKEEDKEEEKDEDKDEDKEESPSESTTKSKSALSASAPEFIPVIKLANDNDSETWKGYPAPTKSNSVEREEEEEEDDDEVWKGYPGPNADSPRRGSSQSETSEEWKGYHATKMEADWQRESAMKVQEYEWQGYTLETYNEDELDSSTMLHGKF